MMSHGIRDDCAFYFRSGGDPRRMGASYTLPANYCPRKPSVEWVGSPPDLGKFRLGDGNTTWSEIMAHDRGHPGP